MALIWRVHFSNFRFDFCRSAFLRISGWTAVLLLVAGIFAPARAQRRTSSAGRYSRHVLGPIEIPPSVVTSDSGAGGPGLTIIPTYDTNSGTAIDANTQKVINSVISYYNHTIQTNLTVHIYFYNTNSLDDEGESWTFTFTSGYSNYRTGLSSSSTSPDDNTALANTPSGGTNPITGSTHIYVDSAIGLAVGLNTQEQLFNFAGSPCPGFTGSGCIGIYTSLAHDALVADVEHEIDEVLGLGSTLGFQTPDNPFPEDLYRWASAGTHSFATNPDENVPCGGGTPHAFFSIDGGTTDLNEFNNCDNGGDYGDWITHYPGQVQDAFDCAPCTYAPLLVRSTEIRALDVIGYKIAFRNFAQPAVFRPSSGQWFVIPVDNPGTPVVQQWGASGDVPLRGDFDGDGIADIAVWRPSTGGWWIVPSSHPASPVTQYFGLPGDIPVPGDYDGDGITDIAVWRPSTGGWWIVPSSNPGSPIIQYWGLSGDIPVPGDYDGDRKTDVAIWRPSSGQWYVIPSGNPGTPIVQSWGLNGDMAVPGDYDGDGKTDFAVWRSGGWWIIPSSNPASPITQYWGLPGDVPVPGDYDGDGMTDTAVWRPSTGQWFVVPSANPMTPTATSWGLSGDIPVQKPVGQ